MHRRDDTKIGLVLVLLLKSYAAKDIFNSPNKEHAAQNCYAQPRCVKCRKPHATKECKLTKWRHLGIIIMHSGAIPECVNCDSEGHPLSAIKTSLLCWPGKPREKPVMSPGASPPPSPTHGSEKGLKRIGQGGYSGAPHAGHSQTDDNPCRPTRRKHSHHYVHAASGQKSGVCPTSRRLQES
ncbi:hypothetical protein EVAR_79567_1 [Eumeta japonica]|uniref:Nucleic-acid-binding protein from transposon X-element n=1 Tax=Eumeta variegata TaxID=151549 RepID=A0A4C1UF15_EUMVA|nr:hypothetical protein EVAR_79567_1 [Eumeta japonica]